VSFVESARLYLGMKLTRNGIGKHENGQMLLKATPLEKIEEVWVPKLDLQFERYYEVQRNLKSIDDGTGAVKFWKNGIVVVLGHETRDNQQLRRVVPLGGDYSALVPPDVLKEVNLQIAMK